MGPVVHPGREQEGPSSTIQALAHVGILTGLAVVVPDASTLVGDLLAAERRRRWASLVIVVTPLLVAGCVVGLVETRSEAFALPVVVVGSVLLLGAVGVAIEAGLAVQRALAALAALNTEGR